MTSFMQYRKERARFWIERRRWPHTPVIRMRQEDIHLMREWLREHVQGYRYYVEVRHTKTAQRTGLYSVVVYLEDRSPSSWLRFNLTWT